MALLGYTSFDHYPTSQIFRKFTVPVNFSGGGYAYFDTSAIVPGAGRCGTAALRVQPFGPVIDGTGPHLTIFPGSVSGVIGSAVKINTFDNNTYIYKIKNLGTGDGSTQLSLIAFTDGTLGIQRGGGNCSQTASPGVLLKTSTQALHNSTYYYIELVFTIDGAAGSATVFVNGVNVATVSGVNTAGQGSNAWNGIELGRIATNGGTGAPQIFFDSMYVLDTTGSAPRNARLGDVQIAMFLPNANGTTQGWTAVPGPQHFSMVNDNPADDDASYLSANAAATEETEKYPILPIASGTIYAVQVVPLVKKDDSGLKQITTLARIAGTNFQNGQIDSVSLTDYQYFSQIFAQNPGTSADWTVSDVNGAEFGIRVTT